MRNPDLKNQKLFVDELTGKVTLSEPKAENPNKQQRWEVKVTRLGLSTEVNPEAGQKTQSVSMGVVVTP